MKTPRSPQPAASFLLAAAWLSLGPLTWVTAQTPPPATPRATAPARDLPNETEGSKKLWGALVYAVETADAKREGFPDADAEMAATLAQVFPRFRHFQLLGSRSEALFKTTHSWVAPSKQLCVKFDSKGLTENGRGVKLDLQLWDRGKAIVKTDTILEKDSPIFIEGPAWGQGRLLYVLKLQDDATPAEEPEAS